IALEEIDDHLLSDSRQGDRAPGSAGPRVGHSDPAARVLVLLAVAVPVELDLDAAVFVGPDLLAVGPNDHGGLGARHLGLRSHAGGAELPVAGARQGRELGTVARRLVR